MGEHVLALLEWYVYHGKLHASYLREFVTIGNRISNKTQNQRDLVAHGLWSRVEWKWFVLKMQGHGQTPELKPELDKLSRTFLPQREIITIEKLETIIREIVSEARSVEDFANEFIVCCRQDAPPKYTRRGRDRR